MDSRDFPIIPSKARGILSLDFQHSHASSQDVGTENQGFPWNDQIQGFLGFGLVQAALKALDLCQDFARVPFPNAQSIPDLPPTLPFKVTSSPKSMTSSGIISFFMNRNLAPTRNPDYFSGEEKEKWLSRKIPDFEPSSFCRWNFAE